MDIYATEQKGIFLTDEAPARGSLLGQSEEERHQPGSLVLQEVICL